jgi:hypothetical protein
VPVVQVGLKKYLFQGGVKCETRLASSARNNAILPLPDGYLSAISPHQTSTINAIAYR